MGDVSEHTLLTVAEVAVYLRVAQQTVRKWLAEGSLPVIRLGRSVRIRRSDVETFLGGEP